MCGPCSDSHDVQHVGLLQAVKVLLLNIFGSSHLELALEGTSLMPFLTGLHESQQQYNCRLAHLCMVLLVNKGQGKPEI